MSVMYQLCLSVQQRPFHLQWIQYRTDTSCQCFCLVRMLIAFLVGANGTQSKHLVSTGLFVDHS